MTAFVSLRTAFWWSGYVLWWADLQMFRCFKLFKWGRETCSYQGKGLSFKVCNEKTGKIRNRKIQRKYFLINNTQNSHFPVDFQKNLIKLNLRRKTYALFSAKSFEECSVDEKASFIYCQPYYFQFYISPPWLCSRCDSAKFALRLLSWVWCISSCCVMSEDIEHSFIFHSLVFMHSPNMCKIKYVDVFP